MENRGRDQGFAFVVCSVCRTQYVVSVALSLLRLFFFLFRSCFSPCFFSFLSFVHVGRVAVSVNGLGETRPVPANQFTKAKAYDVKPPRQCLAPVLISGQTNDGPFVALGAAILVHANGPIEGNPGPLWLSSTATTAKNQGKVTTLAPRHPMHNRSNNLTPPSSATTCDFLAGRVRNGSRRPREEHKSWFSVASANTNPDRLEQVRKQQKQTDTAASQAAIKDKDMTTKTKKHSRIHAPHDAAHARRLFCLDRRWLAANDWPTAASAYYPLPWRVRFSPPTTYE